MPTYVDISFRAFIKMWRGTRGMRGKFEILDKKQ
jgi:hypothetical protein